MNHEKLSTGARQGAPEQGNHSYNQEDTSHDLISTKNELSSLRSFLGNGKMQIDHTNNPR
ncbi:MAG: hypothetical protein ACO34E_18255 [Limisphaerales bacterium]